MKMKTLRSFVTSRTTPSTTVCHIVHYLNIHNSTVKAQHQVSQE
jgi:hypothetical protein